MAGAFGQRPSHAVENDSRTGRKLAAGLWILSQSQSQGSSVRSPRSSSPEARRRTFSARSPGAASQAGSPAFYVIRRSVPRPASRRKPGQICVFRSALLNSMPECMYIDSKSSYSTCALVLPSRCAEAVRLSRLGHIWERTGREVHPLSAVAATQRVDRRHLGCVRRLESFDRFCGCLRTTALPQGRIHSL